MNLEERKDKSLKTLLTFTYMYVRNTLTRRNCAFCIPRNSEEHIHLMSFRFRQLQHVFNLLFLSLPLFQVSQKFSSLPLAEGDDGRLCKSPPSCSRPRHSIPHLISFLVAQHPSSFANKWKDIVAFTCFACPVRRRASSHNFLNLSTVGRDVKSLSLSLLPPVLPSTVIQSNPDILSGMLLLTG